MSVEAAVKKLETSNQGLNVILENLDEQLAEIRLDPRIPDKVLGCVRDDIDALTKFTVSLIGSLTTGE